MTLQEFKAWFGGFTEELSGAPNKKQWERIKERVKEIDGAAVSYPVFVDRYLPPVRRYWDPIPYWSAQGIGTCSQAQSGAIGFSACESKRDDGRAVFNSAQAMLALGKADFQNVRSQS